MADQLWLEIEGVYMTQGSRAEDDDHVFGFRFLGFPDDENGVPNASGAFKGGKTEVYDAMARYRMKLFNDKVDWSLQLNIRNIFDDTSLKASSTDGTGSGNIVRWRYQVPRTYQLTNTFRF